jgi:hypothetical protein
MVYTAVDICIYDDGAACSICGDAQVLLIFTPSTRFLLKSLSCLSDVSFEADFTRGIVISQ